MRRSLSLLFLMGLAACGGAPRNDSYAEYMAEREARLSGGPASEAALSGPLSGPDVSAMPLTGAAPVPSYAAPRGSVPVYPAESSGASSGNVATSGNVEPQRAAAFAGISDEQSFSAVTSRESIESDRARIERSRAQYLVIAPTALPQRRASGGPNIVEYALQTRNPLGEPVYTRINPLRGSLNARACARYASPDLAQETFLKSGGPDRDTRNLDPDGDGYACAWDPAPFRTVLR